MSNPPVCDYEGSDYQDSFWGGGIRAYEDKAEANALKRLLPEHGKLLLELGAGAGRNTPRYAGFERVVLLDYSRTQLEQARSRMGDKLRFTYVAADIYKLPFVDGLFDAATMIRTLHHMADAPLALRKVRYAMQPGAVFILEYANKHNLKAILRYLLKRQEWSPFTLEPVEFEELNFDFHPKEVRGWLRELDFTLERQLTVSHFRMGLVKQIFPPTFLAWLDSLASLTGELWQLSPSVFTRSVTGKNGVTAAAGAFFKCPACGHAELEEGDEMLVCKGCGSRWGVRDGIYDFKEALK
ncbi:methyltransferase domain-containing protein [Chloroflexota bacterium]